MEFGSRRAQGADGAVLGARARISAAVREPACTLTDELYGVPASGTMAHSWVQMFDSEYEAFRAYCEVYPQNATLLVDTYNTLKSGVPNAIRASRKCWFLVELRILGFDWIPAIFPIFPKGQEKCWTKRDWKTVKL